MPGGHRGSILGKLPWGAAELSSDAEEEEKGGLQGELRVEANVDQGVGGSRHGRQSALLRHSVEGGEG